VASLRPGKSVGVGRPRPGRGTDLPRRWNTGRIGGAGRSRAVVAALSVALLAALPGCGNKHDKVATRKPKASTTSSSEATTSSSDATSTTTLAGAATTRRPSATTARPGTTAGGGGGGAPVGLKLTRVAPASQPVALAQAPGDDAVYFAEQGGAIKAIRGGQVRTVFTAPGISSGGERGLLGLAFDPNRPMMTIYYTASNGDIHIDNYPFSGGRVTGSARNLVSIAHSQYANHNGGNVVYGPDGFIYAGTGDGGSGGDPNNRAQNPSDRLGKMLRIDPTSAAVDVWMIGLRNPWRWSFDAANGDMWIGDVGQDAWEEIDFAKAGTHGQNFGWNRREGKHAYNGGTPPAGNVDPVYDYAHSGSVCAVTGGYVYRGSRLTGWGGTYFFADYCVGKVMAWNGTSARDTGLSAGNLSSFGEDRNREVYVLSQAGSGGVFRIDPA
jgi:glucose/arabinose dehydrogenase